MNAEQRKQAEDHLHLAKKVAGTLAPRMPFLPFEEILGAAYEGLCWAARDYDPSRGLTFEKYVIHRCWNAVIDEARTQDQMTRRGRKMHQAYWRAQGELVTSLGREPSMAEVVAKLNPENRTRLIAAARSSYGPSTVEFDLDLVDPTVDVEGEVSWAMAQADVRRAAENLHPRLRYVYTRLFLDEASQAQVGRELGVTDSRISQLRAEIIRTLRREVLPEAG